MCVRRTVLAALLGATLCSGCGPKLVRETVYENEGVRVELRRTIKDGAPVARGYAHPATIADVRLAHILALVSYEDASGKQRPTIRSEHVYLLAEGMARAVADAGPGDEIAAVAFPMDRRMGVFERKRVTAFRAFFQGEDLILEFYAIEEILRRQELRGKEYKIPAEAPNWAPGFTLVAGKAEQLAGRRSLRIDWRSPRFARAPSLRLRDGQLKRRTILMEAEPAPEETPTGPEAPPLRTELQDAQLRALDEIDAARGAGLITESEFHRRRRLVIEGRLEEAGHAAKPGE